ncbi:hypothetical protein CDAR_208071 [Caerostris darwini]|uniref:Uncharacterized protein n=1 Tax=Caerostris darwini TaxID=1538125 RepID=A0AAV4W3K9_9ARAC|nr:hypothetical protein CDAR_208071 [Caerostris darwini]
MTDSTTMGIVCPPLKLLKPISTPVQKSVKNSTTKSKSTKIAHDSGKPFTSPSSSSVKQTSNIPNTTASFSSAYKLPAVPKNTNYKLRKEHKNKNLISNTVTSIKCKSTVLTY